MALLRINNISLPVKPGSSALYPKCTLCSLVSVILPAECDFGIFLAVCVSSDMNLLCIFGTLLSCFSALLRGAARSRTTAVCNRGRLHVFLKTAKPVHGENRGVFIYHLTFVFGSGGFGVWDFFSCECTVERVVKCHCFALFGSRWKNSNGILFSFSFFFSFFFFLEVGVGFLEGGILCLK